MRTELSQERLTLRGLAGRVRVGIEDKQADFNAKIGNHAKPPRDLTEKVNDPLVSLGVVDSRGVELLYYLAAYELNSVMELAH
ncbi:hypothetical protein NDU88_001778 [Pleurodeles waltl]|uniref:Uncharacterized protein n=1 Tax=Pleurodeles waltl TaxID=8319 RepID=A0AAV7M692_PLEWA|nr:hypothetical protein NDU88_001778 [Pleurodeles waltl]